MFSRDLGAYHNMSIAFVSQGVEIRSVLISDALESDSFKSSAGVPDLYHLDALVICKVVNYRIIVIQHYRIGGSKIVDEPEHLEKRTVGLDTCLKIEPELELFIQSAFYHPVVDKFLVSAYLRTGGRTEKYDIAAVLGKSFEE